MSDGYRRLRINTQERAISPDINRLQSFGHQDLSEMLRQLLGVQTSDDDPGVAVAPNTLGTPLLAEVIGGLMVKPQAGSFDLFVDPGVLYALAPDAAPDESNYKYIRDDGIAGAGLLQMTANASGQIRIDVIECQINTVENIVTDSRDIFNVTTGLFAAATVTKELRGQLSYRVRAGAPGAGIPAHQAGWLPICVASVPDGTVTNNTITFWDVRPLLADRASGPMNNVLANQLLTMDDNFVYAGGGGVAKFVGSATAILKGRRVGGRFRKSVPGASTDFLDVLDVTNQDTGAIAFGAITGNIHVYCATPFGLPRWARYTDGPGGRLPQAPKGILICSATVPTLAGAPSAAIALPAGTGLLGTTNDAIFVELAHWKGSLADIKASRSANKIQYCNSDDSLLLTGAYNVLDTERVDYHLRDQDWPPNAKFALINCECTVTVPATTQNGIDNTISAFPDNAGASPGVFIQGAVRTLINIAGAPHDRDVESGLLRIPLPPIPTPGTGVPASPRLVQWHLASGLTAGGFAIANMTIGLVGFEF